MKVGQFLVTIAEQSSKRVEIRRSPLAIVEFVINIIGFREIKEHEI